jgi:hypothetical protein
MLPDESITISLDETYETDNLTVNITDPNLTISGDLSICTTSLAPSYSSAQCFDPSEGLIIGVGSNEKKQKIYICEPWQTTNPIDLGDGLIASFPDDMISEEELKKKVYNKLEELHPDKAIKLGLNEENITLRKKSVTIEIDLEGK